MIGFSRTLRLALLCGGAIGLVACGSEDTPAEPSSDSEMADSTADMATETAEDTDAAMPESPDLPAALAGSSWLLSSFQSMSDEEGTTTPENPADYTLDLGTDGTVSMKLNCNRATGTWSAQGTSDRSGTFEFGPLATTRAMCQSPSMDEKIARDAQYIRSYVIEDGMLHLSLMADGGIYSWTAAGAGMPGEDMAAGEPVRESFSGSVTGNDMVEHTITAEAGQTMTVALDGNGTMYFNLLPPSAGSEFFPAIWVGRNEIEPDVFTGTAEETGTYRVLVYLLGNDKDSGATRDYTLDVSVE